MKVFSGLQPQFGWTRRNPPQYRIALRRSDFSDFEGLTPSSALVKRVAEKLVGDSDETPRFALLTNTLPLLETPERVALFEANLFRGVIGYLQTHYPNEMTPYQTGDVEREHKLEPYPDIKGDVVSQIDDGTDRPPLEGYGSFSKPHPQTGKPVKGTSYKALHSDGQMSRIFALRYGPNVNIRGGRPRVADVRQYRRERGLAVYDVSGAAGVGIKAEHAQTLLKEYAIELKGFDATRDMPVLFLNNMLEHGVLHGAMRPSKIDKTQPATRPINGCSFTFYKSCSNP